MSPAKSQPTKDGAEIERMKRLSSRLPTKAARIRALGAAGYGRRQIAEFLEVSYHQVRNVLRQPLAAGYASAPPRGRSGVAEESAPALAEDVAMIDGDPPIVNFLVDAQGRIRLPAEVMSALDVAPGGWIPASFEKGELCLLSADSALRRVRQWMRRPIPKGRDSVDQFIVDKRRDAILEDAKSRKWLKSS